MKKYILSTLAIAAMMASCNNASPKMDEQPASDDASASGFKIAFVEVDSLMTQYDFAKDYSVTLQKKSNEKTWAQAMNKSTPVFLVSGTDDPEKSVDGTELAASLERFVRALPEREQNLFLRRYYYLQPIAEAAEGCGINENTAKVTLHRIRKKLKAHLEKEGFDA